PRRKMGAAPDLRKLEIPAMLVGRKRRSSILGARRGLSAILLTTLFIPGLNSNVYGQISTAGETDQTQLHGGIELDPEGIKVPLIRVPNGAKKSGAEVFCAEAFGVARVRERGGKYKQEVVKTAGRAIKDYYELIHQQYQVPIRHIYVIG